MKQIRKVLWILWQIVWCLPQNLVGLLLFVLFHKAGHTVFHSAVVTAWKYPACASIGCFIFMDKNAMQDRPLLVHEFGHTVQSAVLGWLYLPVIVLPSVIWFSLPILRRRRRKYHISYYSFYTERWANTWGEKVCKEPSMRQAFID